MIEIFYYDKRGVKKGKLKDLALLKKKRVWIDVTNITREEAAILGENFALHPLTIEDLLTTKARIKVEEFPRYLFGVFYGIQRTSSLQLIELDFVLGENFIISNHQQELHSAQELKYNLKRLEFLFKRGVDFIFHKILDTEVDNYFPVLAYIDDQIEEIEDTLRHPHPGVAQRILQLKRQIVEIKKVVLTQREKISLLAKATYVSPRAFPYFRDIYDHAIRVSDAVENYREAISDTFEAYMSTVSVNMNEVMKVLSVITTLALPVTAISGIYGTNFAILPGSSSAFGFWVMVIFMLLLMIGLIYFFKRRRWF